MAQPVVTWSNRAIRRLDEKSLWYLANCGEAFVRSFVQNVKESVDLIAHMPSVGIKHKLVGERQYRRYINHPRCFIYYWHTATQVHIIDLVFTRQQDRP